MGAVFSIDPEFPFLDALAEGLAAHAGGDPLTLARMTVLLPTRRAARSLAEAFLRRAEGRPLLLPRLFPVGDLDAEELAILADEGGAEGVVELAPAVPELMRQLMLTRLVLEYGRRSGTGPQGAAQAAPLAAELARFLDEVAAEGCSLDRLDDLVPAEHAAHWQNVLKFLAILRSEWPAALESLSCLDPAARRNTVLASQAAAWRKDPPRDPVVAAGITAGVPAVAALVELVAALPSGLVVLPGLDREAAAEDWEAIELDPAHPQHLLARLLARLKCAPKEVAPWPFPKKRRGSPARARLLRAVMSPAAQTHRWGALAHIDAKSAAGIYRVDCPGPQEEATAIALLMRETLQNEGATAALVTPDRDLARRVAGELRRWQVEVDDSAGSPLAKTPPGTFLRLVLQCAAEDFAPLPLLALLKHPLAACGLDPAAFRERARRLELAALRGPRPGPGIGHLREAAGPEADFVARIGAALAPLGDALARPAIGLADLVAAQVKAAEMLAATAAELGERRLWRGDAGEALALWLNQLLDGARDFPALAGGEYPGLFEALLAAPVVRPRYGRHPRLFIWGLLEARLQQADRLILGGLNEGTWPARADSDPWLSRPMRRQFGLPPPEQRIGRAAHDFAQCLGAPEVILTRAARVEGTPTVPSRWLLRFETVLRAAGLASRFLSDHLKQGAPLSWQRALDDPGTPQPVKPPEPRPPLEARPRQLSVTSVETWFRDPYAVYARRILNLKKLDPIDQDPGAAERGSFVHRALDRFLKEFPRDLPPDAGARLLAIGQEEYGRALDRASVREFWWPRFERVVAWLVELERDRRVAVVQSFGEIEGKLVLPGKAGDFTLTAKADRIDRLADGSLAILDYKTGALPKPGDVKSGYAPQLPLEAAIAQAGGFPGVPAAAVAALVYWKLSGGDPPGEEKFAAHDAVGVADLAARARRGLENLVARFDDPKTPYRSLPQPEQAPRYSDYGHLARVKEWLLGAGVEE